MEEAVIGLSVIAYIVLAIAYFAFLRGHKAKVLLAIGAVISLISMGLIIGRYLTAQTAILTDWQQTCLFFNIVSLLLSGFIADVFGE